MDEYVVLLLLGNNVVYNISADEQSAPLHVVGNAYPFSFLFIGLCFTILTYDERSGLVLV